MPSAFSSTTTIKYVVPLLFVSCWIYAVFCVAEVFSAAVDFCSADFGSAVAGFSDGIRGVAAVFRGRKYQNGAG